MITKLKPALLALVLLLAACGTSPQGTPTMSSEDVQGTAVSSAWTIVALTQASVPTNTPTDVPTETPVPTPIPTFTPIPSPMLGVTPALVPTSTVDSTDCWVPLSVSGGAAKTTLLVQNQTRGIVTLTIYLNKTPLGDCGYTAYTLGKGDSIVVSYPQGCYSFAAFVNISPTKSTKAFGGGCANNPDKWVVSVGSEVITLNSP